MDFFSGHQMRNLVASVEDERLEKNQKNIKETTGKNELKKKPDTRMADQGTRKDCQKKNWKVDQEQDKAIKEVCQEIKEKDKKDDKGKSAWQQEDQQEQEDEKLMKEAPCQEQFKDTIGNETKEQKKMIEEKETDEKNLMKEQKEKISIEQDIYQKMKAIHEDIGKLQFWIGLLFLNCYLSKLW